MSTLSFARDKRKDQVQSLTCKYGDVVESLGLCLRAICFVIEKFTRVQSPAYSCFIISVTDAVKDTRSRYAERYISM